MVIPFDHKQTTVYNPEFQDFIEVDAGIATLLLTLWDAKIGTYNSCEENEPGKIWIEFYSMKDVERLLTILIKSLGKRVHRHPEIYDWFCYRILGHEGETLAAWHFDAYPNLIPTKPNQRNIYPKEIFESKVELSASVRFPKEDNQVIIDLVTKYMKMRLDNFEELSDTQWDYIKQYLPQQPYNDISRADDRRILNGVLYALKTGCKWIEIPRKFGPYTAIHSTLKKWGSEGILDPILSSIDIDNEDICKERLSKYLACSESITTYKKKKHDNGTISLRDEMAPLYASQ